MKPAARHAVLFAAVLVCGCGGGSGDAKRPTGTLKGKLTVGGKALPAGTGLVFQHPSTGSLFLAITDQDGNYEVLKPTTQMPTGRYDVSVQTTGATNDPTAGAEPIDNAPKTAAAAPPPIALPNKYRNSLESGMGFDLEPGPNTKTFDLKP